MSDPSRGTDVESFRRWDPDAAAADEDRPPADDASGSEGDAAISELRDGQTRRPGARRGCRVRHGDDGQLIFRL